MTRFRPSTPMRQRLLGRLNRVFDKEPVAVLALRIRSPLGLRWRVKDRVLTVKRPELPDLLLGLEGRSIAQLRDDLEAAGVEIAYYADEPEVLVQGALSLVEGQGDQDKSNGDWLVAYTSILYAWADAVGRYLDMARADIPEALKQLVVPTSEGFWSELWASYFGLARKRNETDARLNYRTAYEWRRPRSTPLAIQLNIKNLIGANVRVREPWMEMFTLSESAMSGDHHMPDAHEFCYHTAQLVSPDYLNWPEVMVEAEADRPAGTLYLPPVTRPLPIVVKTDHGRKVSLNVSLALGFNIQDMDGMILSVNAGLSDSFVRKGPMLSREELRSLYAGPLPDPKPGAFEPITICKGEIVLSDGPAFGDPQHHFGGSMLVERGSGPYLSGAPEEWGDAYAQGGMSDYEHALVDVPIDEWFEANGLGRMPAPAYPAQKPIHFGQWGFGFASNEATASAAISEERSSFLPLAPYQPGAFSMGSTSEIARQPFSGEAVASSTAEAELSTAILMGGAAAAQPSAEAELATGILLGGAAAGTSSAAASLHTTPSGFRGTAVASSEARASLTTGIRMGGTAAASSTAEAELTTGINLGGAAVAQSTAEAELTTGILLGGSAQGQSSAAAALTVGSPWGGTAAAQSEARAGLTTGIRMGGAAAGRSQAYASLTKGLSDPIGWPGTDIAAQLSPDTTAFYTKTATSPAYVGELRDTRGNTALRAANETASVTSDNPTWTTWRGRGFSIFAGAQRLDSPNPGTRSDLAELFNLCRGPRTVAVAIRTPAAWPAGPILPIANAYLTSGDGLNVGCALQLVSGSWRPVIRATDSSGAARHVIGNTAALAPATNYFLVFRWNGDGTGDIFVDGIKQAVTASGGAMPTGENFHPTARRFSIGYLRTEGSATKDHFFTGGIGDLLTYGAATPDAFVMTDLQATYTARFPVPAPILLRGAALGQASAAAALTTGPGAVSQVYDTSDFAFFFDPSATAMTAADAGRFTRLRDSMSADTNRAWQNGDGNGPNVGTRGGRQAMVFDPARDCPLWAGDDAVDDMHDWSGGTGTFHTVFYTPAAWPDLGAAGCDAEHMPFHGCYLWNHWAARHMPGLLYRDGGWRFGIIGSDSGGGDLYSWGTPLIQLNTRYVFTVRVNDLGNGVASRDFFINGSKVAAAGAGIPPATFNGEWHDAYSSQSLGWAGTGPAMRLAGTMGDVIKSDAAQTDARIAAIAATGMARWT